MTEQSFNEDSENPVPADEDDLTENQAKSRVNDFVAIGCIFLVLIWARQTYSTQMQSGKRKIRAFEGSPKFRKVSVFGKPVRRSENAAEHYYGMMWAFPNWHPPAWSSKMPRMRRSTSSDRLNRRVKSYTGVSGQLREIETFIKLQLNPDHPSSEVAGAVLPGTEEFKATNAKKRKLKRLGKPLLPVIAPAATTKLQRAFQADLQALLGLKQHILKGLECSHCQWENSLLDSGGFLDSVISSSFELMTRVLIYESRDLSFAKALENYQAVAGLANELLTYEVASNLIGATDLYSRLFDALEERLNEDLNELEVKQLIQFLQQLPEPNLKRIYEGDCLAQKMAILSMGSTDMELRETSSWSSEEQPSHIQATLWKFIVGPIETVSDRFTNQYKRSYDLAPKKRLEAQRQIHERYQNLRSFSIPISVPEPQWLETFNIKIHLKRKCLLQVCTVKLYWLKHRRFPGSVSELKAYADIVESVKSKYVNCCAKLTYSKDKARVVVCGVDRDVNAQFSLYRPSESPFLKLGK